MAEKQTITAKDVGKLDLGARDPEAVARVEIANLRNATVSLGKKLTEAKAAANAVIQPIKAELRAVAAKINQIRAALKKK